MKKYLQSTIVTTGLAIFAMLFGAGNLIFPLKLGIHSGNQTGLGLIAFIISGVLLPLTGLIAMVFFDGNYKEFFGRIGKLPGTIFIFFCMLIIGPLLVMPRIVDLTYELMRPFLGQTISILGYSIFFAIVTFIACYKKNSIVNLLGTVLSPLKLFSLFTIIIIGLWTKKEAIITNLAAKDVFIDNLLLGYNTLDLLGTIFFAYITISILKVTLDPVTANNPRALAKIMIYAGIIGGSLLAIVYVGMGYLGAFHGHGLEHLDAGKMFIETIMRILGKHGALFIALTVFVACLSTMIALSSVVTDYLCNQIFKQKISYTTGLILVLVTTTLVAQFELGKLLQYSEPLINIAYPVLIMLTFCNIAYKLWGFKSVKVPVTITLLASILWFGPNFIKLIKEGIPQVETSKLSDSTVQQ